MPKRQPRIKRTNFVPTLSADILRSSIAATKASAVSWPMPGIVISRLQTAEALVIRLMSASIVATALITAERAHQPSHGDGETRDPFAGYCTLCSLKNYVGG
jgi:hypothetical protein